MLLHSYASFVLQFYLDIRDTVKYKEVMKQYPFYNLNNDNCFTISLLLSLCIA